MKVRSLLSAAIAATLGVNALAAAVEARGATTRLGRFTYDASTRTLRLPWSHARPQVRMYHEPAGRVAYAEFHGPSGKSEFRLRPQALNPGAGPLVRLLQAQNRPAVARLAVRGSSKIRMVPHVVGGAEKGTIVFEILDWAESRVSHPIRWLARTYDHNHVGFFSLLSAGASLKLPISGPKPTWKVIREGDRLESVEINGTNGIPAFFPGPQQLREAPTGRFERVFLTRNRDGVIRLSIRSRDAAPDLNPRLVPQGNAGLGWVLVFDPPPAVPAAIVPPAPVAAAPQVPPPPAPVAVLPVPPAPAASKPPPPALAPENLEPEFPSRFMLGGRFVALNELLPDAEGAAPITAPQPGELPILSRTLYWRHKIANTWATELDVRWWERYQVVDELDRSNRHDRDEGWVRLGLSRNLNLYGLTQNTWGSLEVRGVAVQNAKKAIIREYLFANSQWYVSPAIGTAVTMPIWGPLSAVAQIQAQPIFSFLEDRIDLADGVVSGEAGTLQQLPFMFGANGEFGLEASLERWVARLSYRYETVRPFIGDFQTLNSGGLSIGYRY